MNKLKVLSSLLFLQLSLNSLSFATDFSINSNSINNMVGMPMPQNMYLKMKLSEIGEFLVVAFVFLVQILIIGLICLGLVRLFKKFKTFLNEASNLKHIHKLIDVKITDELSNSNEIEELEPKQLYNKMLDTFVGRLNYYFNIPAAFLGPLWFFYRNAIGIGILLAIPTMLLIILYVMFPDDRNFHQHLDIFTLLFMIFNLFLSSKIYVLWSKYKVKKIIQNNPNVTKTELLALSENNPSLKKAIIALIIGIILRCIIPALILLIMLIMMPVR